MYICTLHVFINHTIFTYCIFIIFHLCLRCLQDSRHHVLQKEMVNANAMFDIYEYVKIILITAQFNRLKILTSTDDHVKIYY